MKIGFKRVHPYAKLPVYAHNGDAGMDVYAVENCELFPFTPTLVKTGLIAEIPSGYELQVRPRSGMALKEGITVWNAPGTIDSGYRSEIGVILFWAPKCWICTTSETGDAMLKSKELGSKLILKGDRIAQLVVAPVTKCVPVEVTEVSETDRGTGGFGSTGV